MGALKKEEKRKGPFMERDQRRFLSVANVVSLLAIFLTIGGAWAERVADNADTKRRLIVVEERQKEDRGNGKEDREAIKKSVNETNENVQLILRKLEVIEAINGRRR